MSIVSLAYASEGLDRVRAAYADGTEEFAPWPNSTWRSEDYAAFLAANGKAEPDPYTSPAPTSDDVDRERDRRIDAGITFNGVVFQTRPEDRENIQGAYSLAQSAVIIDGAQAGDYLWHGGATDFKWIAADNSSMTMDAPTMMAFGQAVLAHKSDLIFAARLIKASDPIPSDYATNPAYWP